MRQFRYGVFAVACGLAVAAGAATGTNTVRQIFRPERFTRADTNVKPVQEIDAAAWIDGPDAAFLRFRKTFEKKGTAPLVVDVSADNRFILLLDGRIIARGPTRSDPAHWNYETYSIGLADGPHVMEAVVWYGGAPLAQMTCRRGFVLKASGEYDAQLTTGVADWRAAAVTNVTFTSPIWFTGSKLKMEGTSFLEWQPKEEAYQRVRVVRGPITYKKHDVGFRARDWMLTPATIPDQIECSVRPGAFKAAHNDAHTDARPFAAADLSHPFVARFNALLARGAAAEIPAHTRVTLLWDLGDYYCAYPDMRLDGGAGAQVAWRWMETLFGADKKKGDRAAVAGMCTDYPWARDTLRADGRTGAHFTSPWWNAGRWCLLEFETQDEPLRVTHLGIIESRYPLENEGRFECDDATLNAVQKICVRGMQMCAHETMQDCPYYEQQMYPGDTRIQLQILSVMTRSDRMTRHAMNLFDWSRRDDGTLAMNYPCSNFQESLTYSLIYPLMFRDYVSWHGVTSWLRARVPGMRATLFGAEVCENADGLLERLPGWSFIDWVPEWDNGNAPDGRDGQGISSINNLFYLYALQAAADVEQALGNTALETHWRAKAKRLAVRLRALFWNGARGLVADTVRHDAFSEHAQCLAILTGLLSTADEARAFKGLTEDADLSRATVYFSHYLFDVLGRHRRTDLILKRLDLWRGYVNVNLCTPQESPGDARSDCHAWGSHPLYHLHTKVAGVTPAEPGFRTVRVAPAPGPLTFIRSSTPHPQGAVKLDLRFNGTRTTGTVELPPGVTGVFEWNGASTPLHPGVNTLPSPPLTPYKHQAE